MKYFIIGDEDAVLGFGMVGVHGTTCADAEGAERAFRDVIADKDVSIVLITERISDLIRPLVDRYLFSESFPLIVEIPDRKGSVPGKPDIRRMVNEAIGIKL